MAKRINIPEGEYLKGLGEIEANLSDIVSNMKSASNQGLVDAGMYVAAEAQKRAPIESGDLRSSAHVSLNNDMFAKGNSGGSGLDVVGSVPSDITTVKVGFNSPYAAVQHEHTEYDHSRTDGYRREDGSTVNMVAGGQAKYLESVVIEHKDRILAAIAGKMSGAIFGGGDGDD